MTGNLHQEGTEEEGQPSIENLRRFSFGVGFALLIYVIAGGEFKDTFQSPLTPIVHFENPKALLWAFILAVVYSSYRYWYYGIHLAPTRTKMRAYLRSRESTLVFIGNEQAYEATSTHVNQTQTKDLLSALCRRLPPGLPRSGCIVITHGVNEDELVKEQVAKKLEHYFPGLKAKDTSIDSMNKGLGWAHVSSISGATYWLSWIEDAELYLPLTVNGFALMALTVRELWPWFSKLVH